MVALFLCDPEGNREMQERGKALVEIFEVSTTGTTTMKISGSLNFKAHTRVNHFGTRKKNPPSKFLQEKTTRALANRVLRTFLVYTDMNFEPAPRGPLIA